MSSAIQRQLNELLAALTDNESKRTLDLERAVLVAQQLQEKLVPLLNWCDDAELSIKKLKLQKTKRKYSSKFETMTHYTMKLWRKNPVSLTSLMLLVN